MKSLLPFILSLIFTGVYAQEKELGSGTGNPREVTYTGGGSGTGSGYSLGNRKATLRPVPNLTCQESGRVAVQISVDRKGNVLEAVAGVRGTTNTARCLVNEAKKAALLTKWEPDENAPEVQKGLMIYTFSLN